MEFVLEGAVQREAGSQLKPTQRTSQYGTGAALPRLAIEMKDVAQREILDWTTISEINRGAASRIGHQYKIAECPIGARGNSVEARYLDVRRRPADAWRAVAFPRLGENGLAAQLA
jgi:hypothetical protein